MSHWHTQASIVIIACCATGLVHGVVAQQQASVSGTILDAISGDPIGDVLITIVGTDLSARTDTDGHYVIAAVAPGLVKVVAQIIGYHSITTPYYNLRPGTTTPVHFKLAPLQVQLEAVEVVGERPSEAWAFGSRVIRSENLPRRGNILDALDGVVAGIRRTGRHEDTRLSVRGSNTDMLYVLDGVVIRPPLTFHVDASEVECVEVRRGYRAVQEFRPSIFGETYSGVLLIWTKGSGARKPRECTEPKPGSN